MSFVHLENLHKTYSTTPVLRNIELSIEKGEFATLLGPSGCGKSTILRIIAGLTEASSGQVIIDGKNLNGIPPKNRGVGMVFQSYALFPNMTVYDNVAFGLTMMKIEASHIAKRVDSMLQLVNLSDKKQSYPHQLSGGQQQRVALARALIVEPKVLLLDEPLSALDAQIRKKLQADLRSIQRELNMTMVLVTHDQEEAMAVSDKIIVMNHGEIAQCGDPFEIYTQPKTEFVANFIGHYNVFTKGELESLVGETMLHSSEKYAIRPEAISIGLQTTGYQLRATVSSSIMTGNIIRTFLQGENCTFSIEQLHHDAQMLQEGKTYSFTIDQKDVISLQ